MKTISKQELQYRIQMHGKWLKGGPSGERIILSGYDLSGSDLSGSNLRGSDLSDSDLSYSNLRGSNLSYSDLRHSDLSGSNLNYSDLSGSNLPNFQICPEIGSFMAFKKTTKGVIEILIPEEAKRTSSLIGRKCRASHVVVMGGIGIGGVSPTYGNLVYNQWDVIYADKFDSDIRQECTNGIHFFMTKKEAEEW